MKLQEGGFKKKITHYEDLYSALMAPASTVFQDDYAETCEPEHALPDAQTLFTIVTPFGKYQYLRLPMGISCSPYIFQEKMSNSRWKIDDFQKRQSIPRRKVQQLCEHEL
jgi:hypothetical protein